MNKQQIDLVQSSFARVAPDAPAVAKQFYERLFQIAPEVAPLFRDDMDEQGLKLMLTLRTVVMSLHQLEGLLPVIRDLAVRHVGYRVREEHYPHVGAALIWTLRERLQSEFTPEVEEAWVQAYTALSGVMTSAAYPKN